MALERRCAWRGIPVRVDEVRMGESSISRCRHCHDGWAPIATSWPWHTSCSPKRQGAAYVEDGGSLLAICGSYQLLGRSYYMGDHRIEGLGVITAETVRGSDRLIGNVAVKTDLAPEPFVGFENHGGRTLLDAEATPLGTSVVAGTGNNGDDGFEGLIYKGVIGTYLHGPVLPKNPELADWLITHALERRGDAQATALLPLKPLDDTYEHAAHDTAMKLLP
ncbi:MAG: type 1 glutamine amidotransferase [Collinsella sp.]